MKLRPLDARNGLGIFFALALLFSACSQSVTDVDGNRYATVDIGEQTWMAGDLRTTRFRDGSEIPLVEGYEEWAKADAAAYCWYNNDEAAIPGQGALYNAYVLESGEVCPEGWHLPSDEEWSRLQQDLGSVSHVGAMLKEEGTAHWKTPNEGADNRTGFTALPGGYRSYNGTFNLSRIAGFWWSSSEASWYGAGMDSSNSYVFRNLRYDTREIIRSNASPTNGFSIRCVKDGGPELRTPR
ncbi:MAG: fibrobacter succinogenes major paralogous domain-containing protein [Bacteroidales bacterium]